MVFLGVLSQQKGVHVLLAVRYGDRRKFLRVFLKSIPQLFPNMLLTYASCSIESCFRGFAIEVGYPDFEVQGSC